ncbi:MAG: hypothetical protein IJ039_08385 [Clostridia bacterium]|nr:hypothetical protein [Clostridia bacterium]
MENQGYILRYYLPIKPHFDEEYTEKRFVELIDFCKRTSVGAVMFYVALDPNWYYMPDTVEYARQSKEQMLPYIKRLREAGISYQLNFQNILGATLGGVDFTSVFNWEMLVDHKGRKSLGCGCPIGECFREQAGERLRIWTETKPDVIWIDDDFRYHNHGTPIFARQDGESWYNDYYCFCDEHLRLFNEKYQTSYDREELICHMTKCGEPLDIRKKYLDFLGETIAETADWIRHTVQTISPETRIAQMTSVPDAHSAEGRDWNNFLYSLCGEYSPIVRPHFGPYKEGNPRDFIECYRALAQTMVQLNSNYQGKVEYCPEVENTRFTVWSKSTAATAFQLRLSAFMGCKDITLSLYDLDGGALCDEPAYEKMLIKEKPYFHKLVALGLGDASEDGVIIPISQSSAKNYHMRNGDNYETLGGKDRYIDKYLLRMGIPCCYLPPEKICNGIVALDSYSAGFLSNEKLNDILSGAVLIDGGAARTLVERGFGDKIGIKTLKKQNVFINSEIFTDQKRIDGTYIRVPSRIPFDCWFDMELNQKAQKLSEFVTPDGKKYPALTCFGNNIGGMVVTYPAINDFGDGFFTHHRVKAFKDVLGVLSPTLPRIDCNSYALSVVKKAENGDRYYFVANLSTDTVDEITINGNSVKCTLNTYGTVVVKEKDGGLVEDRYC